MPSIALDTLATFVTDDGGHAIAPGATASRDSANTIVVVAPSVNKGVSIPLPGTSFVSGTDYNITFWMKAASAGTVVRTFFGHNPLGEWAISSPDIALDTNWQQVVLTWTPATTRSTAFLAVRSQSTASVTVYIDDAVPAAPPPPVVTPPVEPGEPIVPELPIIDEIAARLKRDDAQYALKLHQNFLSLAVEPGDILMVKEEGVFDRLPVGQFGQVLTAGISGFAWKGEVGTPPGDTAYSNATLFANTSWWRTALPATPTLYSDATLREQWRVNLCNQLHVDPAATGAFGVPVSSSVPQHWFNVGGNNFMIYVVDEDEPLVGCASRYITGANKTDGTVAGFGFGPWLRPEHDATMEGVPIPSGATPSSAAADHALCIYQPSTDTLWEFLAMWPVGAPVITAAVEADGRYYDGNPPGVFEGKEFGWTYSAAGRMTNVSGHNGVYKNIGSNPQTEYNLWGAAATHFPYMAGLITPEEAAAVNTGAAVDFGHTLKCHLGNANPGAMAPAVVGDGTADSTWMPEGARFYISASVGSAAQMTDFSPYTGETKLVQALIRTLAKYGMMGSDKTGLGFDGPCWRNPETYTAANYPYDESFYPDFFGPAGTWRAGDVLQRIPWHLCKIVDPALNPA